jgi:hypothetical protein
LSIRFISASVAGVFLELYPPKYLQYTVPTASRKSLHFLMAIPKLFLYAPLKKLHPETFYFY